MGPQYLNETPTSQNVESGKMVTCVLDYGTPTLPPHKASMRASAYPGKIIDSPEGKGEDPDTEEVKAAEAEAIASEEKAAVLREPIKQAKNRERKKSRRKRILCPWKNKHNMYTHSPYDPQCEVCRANKVHQADRHSRGDD